MTNPSLKKEVSLRQLFALGFGSIIGVGWITVMGAWIAGAGAFGTVLAFALGAIVVILIALCYAEMATRFPATGGEIVYVHEVFGLRSSFLIGWLLAIGYTSVVIFEVISVGWIMGALFPPLTGPTLYSIGDSQVTLGGLLAGVVGMVVIAWFNIRGAKSAAMLQEVMSFVLIVLTIAFCTFAFINGDPTNFEPAFVLSLDGLILPGILSILITVPFWFSGFDVIPQAMGEKAEGAPMTGVPVVLVLSVVAAALFYIAVILAASIAMPRAELLAADLPVAEAMTAAFGSTIGGKIVLFAGLMGLITGWNSFTYGAARVLFALGRAKIIFSVFGKLDEKRRTPAKAIMFISVLGIVGSFFGRSAIMPVVDTGAFAFISVYAAVCIAALWHGFSKKPLPKGAFVAPGGLVLRLLAVFVTLALAGYAFYHPLHMADGSMPL
ncbi:MAG: APC family permease, partial [Pseudomonadota bacterium]